MAIAIDRKMLPMKAHFLLYNSSTAPVVPFMATYARQLGFSKVTVGLIYTLLPFIALVVKPVFGYFGDRFRMRKTIVFVMCLLFGCSFLCIRFIRPISVTLAFQRHWHVDDANAGDVLEYCPDVDPVKRKCIMGQVLNQQTVDNRMQCELHCSCRQPGNDNAVVWSDRSLDIGFVDIEQIGECVRFPVLNDAAATAAHCGNTTRDGSLRTEYCLGTCNNANVMHIFASNRDTDDATDRPGDTPVPTQLWLFIMLLVIAYGSMPVVDSMGVTMCFALLGKNTHRFGKQRLWGSFGWGAISMLSGFLLDQMSRGQALKDYSGVFYLAVGFVLCDMLAITRVENNQTPRTETTIVKDVAHLLLSPRIVVFFVWCAAAGIFCSFIWNFLFWHLEELSEANAASMATAAVSCGADYASGTEHTKTLQGLAMGIQTFGGEIPLFFLSGTVLKRIGHEHAMSLVLAAYAMRFLLYSVLIDPWWALAIQPLQGVTFGIFFATMSSYASRVAPPGAEAVLQGMAGAVFEGVGVSSGGVIGGYAMDYFGGSVAYRLFGYCALVLCVLHVIVQLVFARFCPFVCGPAAISPEMTDDILKSENEIHGGQ